MVGQVQLQGAFDLCSDTVIIIIKIFACLGDFYYMDESFLNQEEVDVPTMQSAWEFLELARLVFVRFVLKL